MAKWYRDEKGYPRFRDSDELVHRWKAEKMLGRELRDGEVVHHKDGCKTDYSDKNLKVYLSQSEHMRKGHRRWW